MSQLALPIRLDDHAVFESFHAAGNEQLVDHLERLAQGDVGGGCWIAGARASGKTHLLQASCERARGDAVYLSAALLRDAGPEMLDGLSSRSLIAIDDIDTLLGDPGWESALFGLCNELLDVGGRIVVSAAGSQRDTAIALDDLSSRLAALPAFVLRPLGEDERVQALKLRARHRGLELPDETANYLLTRSRRDMGSLYGLLDHLDREALRAQRRLTVPFVRDVLKGGA